jgi:uncharacterized phage-associated protein
MKQPYDSILIAEFVKAKAFEKGVNVKIPTVHKMLYLLYGFYLAKYNSAVFNEQPRAWPSGPAFPNIEKALTVSPFQSVNDPKFKELKSDPVLMEYVNDIVRVFSEYSDDDLGYWLRIERAPWRKLTSKPDFMWNDVIHDYDIKSYFSMFEAQAK